MNLGNYSNQEASIEIPTYIHFPASPKFRDPRTQPSGVGNIPPSSRRRFSQMRRPRWLFSILDRFQRK